MMASKVVSTKLSEEEYGKLVGLSSSTGYTISKLLKRAILAKMNEERMEKPNESLEKPKPREPPMTVPKEIKNRNVDTPNQEERFLYY